MSRHEAEGRILGYSIAAGLTLFYLGLKKLKISKQMDDIPTSKIDTAAVGCLVEVQGRVVCEESDLVKSPLSNRRGACFILELQRKVRSGKSSKWVKVIRFYSLPYLYISDGGDHLAMVDIANCEFHDNLFNETNLNFNNYSFKIPVSAKKWLNENGILNTSAKGSFFAPDEFRLKEKVFRRNDLIYVLGPAVTPPQDEAKVNKDEDVFGKRDQDPHEDVDTIYNEIVKGKMIPQEYDKNNDHKFDEQELKQLYADIQKKMFSDFRKGIHDRYLQRSKIFFTLVEDHEHLFSMKKVNISFMSEHKARSKLYFQGLGMIILGPIIILAGIYLTFFNR